jgi:hypothetical protein
MPLLHRIAFHQDKICRQVWQPHLHCFCITLYVGFHSQVPCIHCSLNVQMNPTMCQVQFPFNLRDVSRKYLTQSTPWIRYTNIRKPQQDSG